MEKDCHSLVFVSDFQSLAYYTILNSLFDGKTNDHCSGSA